MQYIPYKSTTFKYGRPRERWGCYGCLLGPLDELPVLRTDHHEPTNSNLSNREIITYAVLKYSVQQLHTLALFASRYYTVLSCYLCN